MSNIGPHLFIIFGATGDLAHRKLLPSIYRLFEKGALGRHFHVLGVARDARLGDAGFGELMLKQLRRPEFEPGMLEHWCGGCLHYQSMPDDGDANYAALAQRIEELESRLGLPGNRVFYLALPPAAFPTVITALGRAGLNRSPGWTRLVVEKPFGTDLESAQELNRVVHHQFDEEQVYRIDHYLGKETVQNLLAFRFANPLFEHAWNRDRIERVEITVAESLGVEHRAGYYDRAGALRDMVQNHLTQLLSFIAMEVPTAFEADAIRHEKVKVLRSIAPIGEKAVVFGQYAAGAGNGRALPAYLEEEGVAAASTTPTFVALKLAIDNWRWQGVPFYLRTGKRLPGKLTEIAILFRAPPTAIFKPFEQDCEMHGDVLRITLEPNEGFHLGFDVKVPGGGFELSRQQLKFRYAEVFERLPTAYETLLLDVMEGDQTLFVRADEVETSWRLYTPVLRRAGAPHPYPSGSWGPAAVGELLDADAWVSDGKD